MMYISFFQFRLIEILLVLVKRLNFHFWNYEGGQVLKASIRESDKFLIIAQNHEIPYLSHLPNRQCRWLTYSKKYRFSTCMLILYKIKAFSIVKIISMVFSTSVLQECCLYIAALCV